MFRLLTTTTIAAVPCFLFASFASGQGARPADRDAGSNSYVMQWGPYAYDTRSREGRLQKVACGWNSTAHLRSDGRLFVQGVGGGLFWGASWTTAVPTPPAGLHYTDVSINSLSAIAIRSDGMAVAWGEVPVAPPTPPQGLTYLGASISTSHGLLLRSDGMVVAFGANNLGQCNVPALPAGVGVVDLHAVNGRSLVLMADGSVVLFGSNQYGEGVAPILPPGVTYAALGKQPRRCTLLLRSDGWIEAFGDNSDGQCNVPPLPPGLRYEHVGGGDGWAAAVRSDNTFVTWGVAAVSSPYGIDNPPPIPVGQKCVGFSVGQAHAAALLTDGTVISWGHNNFYDHYTPYRNAQGAAPRRRHVHTSSGVEHSLVTYSDGTMEGFGLNNAGQIDVPQLPSGVHYVKGAAGGVTSLALRSDGRIEAFGFNGFGALNVPPLPVGMTYVDMTACHGHAVVLRSDGRAFGFGENSSGQCNIPPLPPGVTYVDASVNENRTLLLRSDGLLAYCGLPYGSPGPMPQPPAGERFVDIAASGFYALALASDNSVALWGYSGGSSWQALQPLPFGVYYVEIQGGYYVVTLRRSDGAIDVFGVASEGTASVPPLDPGTSCLQLSGTWRSPGARMGPTCTYVGFAPGCAGSLPPSRLIPRDTPRIGRVLEVGVDRLPNNLALMAMGFQRSATAIPLGAVGMPGCNLHIQYDATAVLVGQGGKAQFLLPIPDVPALVGLRFQNQALVLDTNAGNSLGAVMSEASEGVIGYP